MEGSVFLGQLDDSDFITISADELGLEVIDGDPNIRMRTLREGAGEKGTVRVGVSHLDPCTLRYTFGGDETIYLVEGDIRLTANGDEMTLGPGNLISFGKGVETEWVIRSPVTEIFVSHE